MRSARCARSPRSICNAGDNLEAAQHVLRYHSAWIDDGQLHIQTELYALRSTLYATPPERRLADGFALALDALAPPSPLLGAAGGTGAMGAGG